MQTTDPHDDDQHAPGASSQASAGSEKLPGIRHVIAVGSGKGGVGKSTVSVNLAFALQQIGGWIGLVDADILGPSIPGMLGLPVGQPPTTTPDGKIVPADCHNLKVMSMGMLTGDDNPAILRGPMVGKYLKMFIGAVQWGRLDYLILDLPPGTGDTQLTLAQSYPLSGAIIVTTPQDVSLKIARRGLRMFETVHVPILGIIENMSTFTCPHCGKGTDVFRSGGGERMSRELGVPFLGAIPLDADIVMGGDKGRPIVLEKPNSVAAMAYLAIATELAGRLQGLPTTGLKPFAWTWETGKGEPRLGRECHPTIGLANDGDWLPPARHSHAVRALGGRPAERLRRPGPPIGVPMRGLCRRDERAPSPGSKERATGRDPPHDHQRGQLRHHHQLERRSQHGDLLVRAPAGLR